MIGFPLTKARVAHSTTDYAILLCIMYTCKMELFCVRFIASCKLCKSFGKGPDSGPFPCIKMISYDIPVSSLYTSAERILHAAIFYFSQCHLYHVCDPDSQPMLI